MRSAGTVLAARRPMVPSRARIAASAFAFAFALPVLTATDAVAQPRLAAPVDQRADLLANEPADPSTYIKSPERSPPCEESPEPPEQVLGQHLFLFPDLQKSAFMTTNINFQQAMELLSVPDAPVRAGRTYDVSALGVAERIDLGVRFLKRFEATIGGSAEAFSGTGIKSALVGGAAYTFDGLIGAGMRIMRSSHTQVAVRLAGTFGSAKRVEFLPVLAAVTAQGGAAQSIDSIVDGSTGRRIITPATRDAVSASFHLAQSILPSLGFQGTAGFTESFIHLDLFENTERHIDAELSSPELAGAVTFDLRPLVPLVPIAFIAEYRIRWTYVATREPGLQEWLDAEQTLGGGVYYSGRSELQVGLHALHILRFATTEGFDSEGHPFPIGRPEYTAFQLTLRYTW